MLKGVQNVRSYFQFKIIFSTSLTYYSPMLFIYTPWKHQKTRDFLISSGGMERDHWHWMGKFAFTLENIKVNMNLLKISSKIWKKIILTLSWRRLLSYRKQSIDLLCESMDWFLYDNGLRRERVKKEPLEILPLL